jgi:transposase
MPFCNCQEATVAANCLSFTAQVSSKSAPGLPRLDTEDLKGLQIKPGRGKKPRLSEAQKAELQSALFESPEKFGYTTTTWSGAIVLNFVQKNSL